MKICPRCGNQNPNDAVYCKTCITPLQEQNLVFSTTEEEEQWNADREKKLNAIKAEDAKKRKRLMTVCFIVVIIIAAIAGSIYLAVAEKRAKEEKARKAEEERLAREDRWQKDIAAFLPKRAAWLEKAAKADPEVKNALGYMKGRNPAYPSLNDAIQAARCADVKLLYDMSKSKDSNIDWRNPEIMIAACKTPFCINVRFIHEQGGDVNAKDERNGTALMWACHSGNELEIVKYLVGKKADPNVQLQDGGESALMIASWQGKLEIVKCLARHGADVDAKDKDGWTALMWASSREKLETVKCLVSLGADVNAKNKAGWTALMWASSQGNLEIVKCLVGKGADVNLKNKDNKKALDYAENGSDIYKLLNTGRTVEK